MATKWYLRDTAAFSPPTSGEKSTTEPVGTQTYGLTPTDKALSATKGTTATSLATTLPNSTTANNGTLGRWTSPLLAAGTYGSGTWTIAIQTAENDANYNVFWRSASLYFWRPSTNAVVGFVIDSNTQTGVEFGNAVANARYGQVISWTGANVTIQNGDVLVFEAWTGGTPSMAGTSKTATIYYDGTVDVTAAYAGTDPASYIQSPVDLPTYTPANQSASISPVTLPYVAVALSYSTNAASSISPVTMALVPVALVATSTAYDPPNLDVVVAGSTATLTWDASPTPDVTSYDIFRRTPSTGSVFDPDTDILVANVSGLMYNDVGLVPGTYDWQVFGLVDAFAFSPDDIAGLVSWYDAADTSTITASAGAVSQWSDKSGNNYHMVQGTSSFQPTTGTRTINSRNTLDFNGFNNRLESSTFSLSGTNAMTAYVVLYADTADASDRIMSFVVPSPDYLHSQAGIPLMWSSSTELGVYHDSGLRAHQSASIGVPILAEVTRNGAVWTINLNGFDGTTDALIGTTNFAVTDMWIGSWNGAPNFFDGIIGEVILYDSLLSTENRSIVRNYLTEKWNLPTPLTIPDLVAWYDASDLSTITSSGSAVSQLNDKSGNNCHMTQPTSSSQPSTGLRTINGRNTISFDGAGDCMNPAFNPFSGKTEGTTVWVTKNSTIDRKAAVAFGDDYSDYGAGQWYETFGTTVRRNSYHGATITNPNVFSMVAAANDKRDYVNGTNVLTSTSNTVDFTTTFVFANAPGAAPMFDGDIAEVIFYDRALSDAERMQVEAYLMEKWIPVPLQITGLQTWYDASDTSTITASSGAVSQWGDKSGNGFHLTQGTSSAQPFSGTRTVNDLNVIDFDGGDHMSSSFSSLTNVTVFVAAIKDSHGDVIKSDTESWGLRWWTDGLRIIYNSGGSYVVDGANVDGIPTILIGQMDNTADMARVTSNDDSFISSSFVFSTLSGSTLYVGGPGYLFNGGIGEILVYDSVLTINEITTVENYLKAKWGTP